MKSAQQNRSSADPQDEWESSGGTQTLPRRRSAGPAAAARPRASRLLVIDDDRTVRHMIGEAFRDTSVEVLTAQNAEEARRRLREEPQVVLLDVVLPELSGVDMFREIRERDARLPVIFITAGGSSDIAIEAMKLGAYDFLLKPLNIPALRRLVTDAFEVRRMMEEPVTLHDSGELPEVGEVLIGRSPAMQDVYKAIGRVAPQNVTVLVRGESGTGKELVARAIYHHSQRAQGPFLAINCAAIPEALLESELFGHEKGSFTSADRRHIGKFEQCSGGTLFLDEVGDMSPVLQSKVLRVLQEQRFERVGGAESIQTDVRVIAATNRDLEKMTTEGEFRSDLYYRLNGFTISLPPLREREADLVHLLEQFLVRYNRELGKDVHGIAPDALELLVKYAWPGNVREMQSVLRQSLLQTTGSLLRASALPDCILHADGAEAAGNGMPVSDLRRFLDRKFEEEPRDLYMESLEVMERYVLTRVLRVTRGNQSQAARMLGLTRGSLRNKIRTLGLSIDEIVDGDSQAMTNFN